MSAPTEPAQLLITMVTSDGVSLKVDRDVAERSVLIKNLLEDFGVDNLEPIPIPNVSARDARCAELQNMY